MTNWSVNADVYILKNRRIATNMTCSYCLPKNVKCVVSCTIFTLYARNARLQLKCKRIDAGVTNQWHVQ